VTKTNVVENRRKELHLSQEDLANQLGISRQYYNAIENLKRFPSIKLAKELANVLQIDWTIFFDNGVNT